MYSQFSDPPSFSLPRVSSASQLLKILFFFSSKYIHIHEGETTSTPDISSFRPKMERETEREKEEESRFWKGWLAEKRSVGDSVSEESSRNGGS